MGAVQHSDQELTAQYLFTWCNMCWARAFIDSFCRQNWMSFLKASMEKICERGKTCYYACCVVMLLGGCCSWFCNSSACRLFDATLALLPPSPQACNVHQGVPWSFRFQGVQLPTFARRLETCHPTLEIPKHCMNKQRWTLDIIPIQPIQVLYIESVPRLLYMIGCEIAHYSFVWEQWRHLKKCRIYGPKYREDRRFQRGTIDRFSLPSNHFSTDMINIQAEDCYLKTRAHRSFHLLDSNTFQHLQALTYKQEVKTALTFSNVSQEVCRHAARY